MMRFLKDWILPIAMAAGAGGYFLFHYAGFLAPLKPAVWVAVDILTPSLIFIQLFLTFCKIDLKDMRLTGWHWTILAFQALSALLMAAVLMFVPMNEVYREIFEGAMVCLICPTATAAAVVTDKLGGSAARITLYNLMSNILAAVFVPVVFPLIELHSEMGFFPAFLKILSKVFPLLICPFLLAVLLRYVWPKAHDFFRARAGIAFYLWAVALALAIGQTVRSMHNSTAPAAVLWMIAGAALLTCGFGRYHYRRSGPWTEKQCPGHLDGIYLPESHIISRSRDLCHLAEHFQLLAALAEKSQGLSRKIGYLPIFFIFLLLDSAK